MRYRQLFLLLGLIAALIAAGVLFVEQRRAADEARTAVTSQFVAETRRETAVFQANRASTAQAQAEFNQGTAIALAQLAVTGQAQARDVQATAVADANLAATAQFDAEAGQGTAIFEAGQAQTAQMRAESREATAVADAERAATAQSQAESGQAAAVARADLAATAESIAVANAYLTVTAQALEATATAEAVLSAPPATPVAQATATPSGLHFVSGDASIQFDYPPGWVIEELETGFVIFANSRSSLVDTLGPGGILGFVFALPTSGIVETELAEIGVEMGETLMSEMSQNPVAFDLQSELTLGGYPAARVEGANADYQAVVYVIDASRDSYLILMGVTLPGELPTVEPDLLVIGESLQYTAS